MRVGKNESRDCALCFEFDHEFRLCFSAFLTRRRNETNVVEALGENRRDEEALAQNIVAKREEISA
jgi:hypothetical protein